MRRINEDEARMVIGGKEYWRCSRCGKVYLTWAGVAAHILWSEPIGYATPVKR